jgi:PAS domain S-box-containing protein
MELRTDTIQPELDGRASLGPAIGHVSGEPEQRPCPTTWKMPHPGCWVRRLSQLSLRRRLLIVAAVFAGYALAFRPLYSAVGGPAGAFSFIPVLAAAALLGRFAGALAGMACVLLNVFLFRQVEPHTSPAAHATAGLAAIVAGAVVGTLRDLRVALEEKEVELEAKQAELERALAHERDAALALRNRELQLRLAQEVSHTGSWVWDLASDSVSWSPELYRIFGVSPEAAPTRALVLERIHADERRTVQDAMERALSERSSIELEHRIVRPDGEVRSVHVAARVLADEAGKAIQMMGTARDVSDLKQMHAKLVLTERMASLGTLAGGVAHEINNPLSYILSNLRCLSEDLSALDATSGGLAEARKLTAETLEGAERVRRIVQDLHTFARPRETRGPIDLHRVLDLAASIASSQIRFHARLVKDYGPIPLVQGDESRLGQVALNLIVNAAQAIPSGRPQENEIRLVTRAEREGRVLLEVRDTGSGIPPEVRSRVFEPFFTTKPVGTGTGLGLSICHGIVTSLGGEITLDSETGRGTTLRVVLPASASAHPVAAAT